jgi:hypothetical protein
MSHFFESSLDPNAMTEPSSSHDKDRRWTPPTIAKLAIGKETKSAVTSQRLETGTGGADAKVVVEPRAPAAPASKFGFSFEWAFPLSARND